MAPPNPTKRDTAMRPDEDSSSATQRKKARVEHEVQLKRARSPSPESSDSHKVQHIEEQTLYNKPPVIYLDPSQRLDLLRRRQKWRQSHLYNIKKNAQRQISAALVVKNPSRYAEASTQTEVIPELKSNAVLSKEAAKNEAEKKLRSGVFSGAILYDQDELNEINNVNKSPVKFNTNKRSGNGSLPISSSSINDLLNDKKKLVQSLPLPPNDTSKPTIEEVEDVPVGPSAGFNFLSNKKVDTEKEQENDSESLPPPKRQLSFGSTNAIKETSTPAFSVSSKTIDKPASLFDKSDSDSDKPASSFVFGASKPAEKKTTSLFDSKSEKPESNLFSFGSKPTTEKEPASTSAFSFSSSAEKDKSAPKASLPAFNFGSSADNVTSTSNTAFKFGGSKEDEKKDTQSEQEKEQASKKPAFSFSSKIDNAEKPSTGFSFGSTSSKPGFTFGTTTSSEVKDSSKSDTAKPLFGGAASASAAKAFSFGSTIEKKAEEIKAPETSSTTSLFGKNVPSTSLADSAPQDTPAKPSLFGTSGTTGKVAESTPSFNFGGASLPKETTKTTAPVSAFSFNQAKKDSPTKPSFNFGATTKPTLASVATPTTEKPSLFDATTTAPIANSSFNFGAGAKPTESKAFSFNFGGSAKPADPASVFGGVNTNPNPSTTTPSFGFGTSTPAASTPFGQQATTAASNSAFNFGATAKPALPSVTSAFGGSNSSFNFGTNTSTPAPASTFGGAVTGSTGFKFGATTTTTDPSKVFGQSTGGFGSQAPPTTGFGIQAPQPQQPAFGSQPTPFAGTPSMFGGAAVAPPIQTGTPLQSRVPGRQIRQIRSRRH